MFSGCEAVAYVQSKGSQYILAGGILDKLSTIQTGRPGVIAKIIR